MALFILMYNVNAYWVKSLHLKAIAFTPCPSSNTILSSASSTAKLGEGEKKTKVALDSLEKSQ